MKDTNEKNLTVVEKRKNKISCNFFSRDLKKKLQGDNRAKQSSLVVVVFVAVLVVIYKLWQNKAGTIFYIFLMQ